MSKVIQFENALLSEFKNCFDLAGQRTVFIHKPHIFGVSDTGTLQCMFYLQFGAREVYPSQIRRVFRIRFGCDNNGEYILLIEVAGEMCAVIMLLQLHSVIIDHTVAGDCATATVNEQDGSFFSVQILQFLCPGTAAMQIHVMVTAYRIQIGEVRDYSGLLTAEGQVNKIRDTLELKLIGHSLELSCLSKIKAFQALGKVVELIYVDYCILEAFQHRPSSIDLFYLQIGLHRIANFQIFEESDAVVVFVVGNGERYCGNTILGVRRVADNSLKYHVFSFLALRLFSSSVRMHSSMLCQQINPCDG